MTSLVVAAALVAALPTAPQTFLGQTGGDPARSARLVSPDEAPLTGNGAVIFSSVAGVAALGASGYGLYLRQANPFAGTALLAAGLVFLQVGPSLSHLINDDPPSFYLFTGIQTFFALGALVALVPFGPVFAGMFGAMWLGSLIFNFIEVGDSAEDWAGRENAKRRRATVELSPGAVSIRF